MEIEVINFKTEEEYLDAVNGDLKVDGEPLYFEYKKRKILDFDGEHGAVDVMAFFQRRTDNKKFYTFFTESGQGEIWVDEDNLHLDEDVVIPKKPKVKTTWDDLIKYYFSLGGAHDFEQFRDWASEKIDEVKFKK